MFCDLTISIFIKYFTYSGIEVGPTPLLCLYSWVDNARKPDMESYGFFLHNLYETSLH